MFCLQDKLGRSFHRSTRYDGVYFQVGDGKVKPFDNVPICEEIENVGFDTHVGCYTRPTGNLSKGICPLWKSWPKILSTIEPVSTLVSSKFLKVFNQMTGTMGVCYDYLKPNSDPGPGSLSPSEWNEFLKIRERLIVKYERMYEEAIQRGSSSTRAIRRPEKKFIQTKFKEASGKMVIKKGETLKIHNNFIKSLEYFEMEDNSTILLENSIDFQLKALNSKFGVNVKIIGNGKKGKDAHHSITSNNGRPVTPGQAPEGVQGINGLDGKAGGPGQHGSNIRLLLGVSSSLAGLRIDVSGGVGGNGGWAGNGGQGGGGSCSGGIHPMYGGSGGQGGEGGIGGDDGETSIEFWANDYNAIKNYPSIFPTIVNTPNFAYTNGADGVGGIRGRAGWAQTLECPLWEYLDIRGLIPTNGSDGRSSLKRRAKKHKLKLISPPPGVRISSSDAYELVRNSHQNEGKFKLLKTYLKNGSINPNAIIENKWTLLFKAVALIGYDSYPRNVFDVASFMDISDILLRFGADPDLVIEGEESLIDYSIRRGRRGSYLFLSNYSKKIKLKAAVEENIFLKGNYNIYDDLGTYLSYNVRTPISGFLKIYPELSRLEFDFPNKVKLKSLKWIFDKNQTLFNSIIKSLSFSNPKTVVELIKIEELKDADFTNYLIELTQNALELEQLITIYPLANNDLVKKSLEENIEFKFTESEKVSVKIDALARVNAIPSLSHLKEKLLNDFVKKNSRELTYCYDKSVKCRNLVNSLFLENHTSIKFLIDSFKLLSDIQIVDLRNKIFDSEGMGAVANFDRSIIQSKNIRLLRLFSKFIGVNVAEAIQILQTSDKDFLKTMLTWLEEKSFSEFNRMIVWASIETIGSSSMALVNQFLPRFHDKDFLNEFLYVYEEGEEKEVLGLIDVHAHSIYPTIRIFAIHVLKFFDPQVNYKTWKSLISDPHPPVRQVATDFCKGRFSVSDLPYLRRLLKSEYSDIKSFAKTQIKLIEGDL